MSEQHPCADGGPPAADRGDLPRREERIDVSVDVEVPLPCQLQDRERGDGLAQGPGPEHGPRRDRTVIRLGSDTPGLGRWFGRTVLEVGERKPGNAALAHQCADVGKTGYGHRPNLGGDEVR